jgi:hypothetical protein
MRTSRNTFYSMAVAPMHLPPQDYNYLVHHAPDPAHLPSSTDMRSRVWELWPVKRKGKDSVCAKTCAMAWVPAHQPSRMSGACFKAAPLSPKYSYTIWIPPHTIAPFVFANCTARDHRGANYQLPRTSTLYHTVPCAGGSYFSSSRISYSRSL